MSLSLSAKSGILAGLLAIGPLVGCSPGGSADRSPPASAEVGSQKVGSLQWAVGGDWRMAAERARDQWRNPVATLTFFGIKPSDTVVELYPGGGWYTAILGPYLSKGGGRLIAALADPKASPSAQAAWDAYKAAFVDRPAVYGQIEMAVASRNSTDIAPEGSADVVLTFRNVHTWMRSGYADKVFADAFRALKPGGVLGIEEHRLPSTRDQDLLAASGYVQQAYVIQLAENAGFVFEEASEINANPKDSADHPLGVWMLPPTLLKPDPESPEAERYDESRYRDIGESDRMTLRFRKPAN